MRVGLRLMQKAGHPRPRTSDDSVYINFCSFSVHDTQQIWICHSGYSDVGFPFWNSSKGVYFS